MSSLTRIQLKYLKEYINGKSTTQIAKKYDRDVCSICKTLHNAIGPKYKGKDLRDISMKELKEIYNNAINS